MRVHPPERRLQNPVDDIEGQIRANLQPTPDRRFRVPEIDPHHEEMQLRKLAPAQLGAARLCVFSWPDAELRQGASELSKVIEPSVTDDRLEPAQHVGLAVVLVHAQNRTANGSGPTVARLARSTSESQHS